MQPLFTIHAGEYLVGSYLEDKFKGYNIWLPAKDTGVDLLVTNAKNVKAVALQVKFSKDYVPTHMKAELKDRFVACGWWTLKYKSIKKSKADLWVFVMQSFDEKLITCVVIPPKVLLDRLLGIHGKKSSFQTYLWITKTGQCWEARGLTKAEKISVAQGSLRCAERDFSEFCNNWKPLQVKLK